MLHKWAKHMSHIYSDLYIKLNSFNGRFIIRELDYEESSRNAAETGRLLRSKHRRHHLELFPDPQP